MNLARVEYYFAKFLSTLELRAQDDEATVELGPAELVNLPPNLFFVGTVNMDETTHGFADKVYDRARLIEIEVSRSMLEEHLNEWKAYAAVMMEIWDAIHHAAPFAFRVLDDIESSVEEAVEGIAWEVAFDEQLLHKILPKFKGSDHRVGEALKKLSRSRMAQFPLTHQKSSVMLERFHHSGFVSFLALMRVCPELIFRNLKGQVIEAPGEWSPVLIEITGLPFEAWQNVRLWRQGEPT